jgi:hypothetical protein
MDALPIEERMRGRWDGGYRRGYRRRFPLFPIWLVIPFVFMMVRGPFAWGFGWRGAEVVFAPFMWGVAGLIPLIVLGIVAVRVLASVGDSMGASMSRRMRERVTEMPVADATAQRLEQEMREARRQIRELEEKVAWQGKLLNAEAARTAATAGARRRDDGTEGASNLAC